MRDMRFPPAQRSCELELGENVHFKCGSAWHTTKDLSEFNAKGCWGQSRPGFFYSAARDLQCGAVMHARARAHTLLACISICAYACASIAIVLIDILYYIHSESPQFWSHCQESSKSQRTELPDAHRRDQRHRAHSRPHLLHPQ